MFPTSVFTVTVAQATSKSNQLNSIILGDEYTTETATWELQLNQKAIRIFWRSKQKNISTKPLGIAIHTNLRHDILLPHLSWTTG